MKVNQNTAIKASNVLLVPYQGHHVPRYHAWMQDPALQEATASEPLTLQEEYQNQHSWRISHNKLTFIICEAAPEAVRGVADAEERMKGDVNLFIHREEMGLRGEIDVMVAERAHWRKGYGSGAVECLLIYLRGNLEGILGEYAAGEAEAESKMVGLMVKIKEGNEGSRALFGRLGFRQSGGVNYFGEVVMNISWKEVEEMVDGWMAGEGARREYEEAWFEGEGEDA